jgi:hypothetical protein
VSSIKESYGDLVTTMKELGAALIPATAVQYEAPPNGAASALSVGGVRNPTLDIVSDPRRSALSNEVAATDIALRQARALLGPHIDALQQATARWEGQEGPTA